MCACSLLSPRGRGRPRPVNHLNSLLISAGKNLASPVRALLSLIRLSTYLAGCSAGNAFSCAVTVTFPAAAKYAKQLPRRLTLVFTSVPPQQGCACKSLEGSLFQLGWRTPGTLIRRLNWPLEHSHKRHRENRVATPRPLTSCPAVLVFCQSVEGEGQFAEALFCLKDRNKRCIHMFSEF